MEEDVWMKNAHDVPQIYERLGIDLRDLGCLMIDTESPVDGEIDSSSTYTSSDPKKFWVDGLLDWWHATVRYGFLDGVTRADVDAVLVGMPVPIELNVIGTEVFPSPYPAEPYDCLVARVESPELTDLNTALGILPNVNTFAEYKPHITIGYFQPGSTGAVSLKDKVKTLGFNYGNKL